MGAGGGGLGAPAVPVSRILSTYKLSSFFLPFHHHARLLCALVIVFPSHFEPSAKPSKGRTVLSSEGSSRSSR